jgi:hypothetical protein
MQLQSSSASGFSRLDPFKQHRQYLGGSPYQHEFPVFTIATSVLFT